MPSIKKEELRTMEKFYNIDEQKFWNNNDIWLDSGHEWSSSFGTTENLWNKEIFDSII